MTDTPDAVYLIGGQDITWDGFDQGFAAQFHFDISVNQDKWRQLENLKQARNSHGSIMTGKNAIIVGGHRYADHSFIEIWDFETGEAMKVDLSTNYLDSYKIKFYGGIAMFPVNADFCKK